MSGSGVRLHVDQPLGPGQAVALDGAQANYLFAVMRLGVGGAVRVFNGRDGEWRADVVRAGKRNGVLACVEPTAELVLPPDLWLAFAPLKKVRTDFVVEKAVEMGVQRILPVQTRHTSADRIRQDRLQAHATEAAEQCGATFVPEVADLQPLARVLDGWPEGRRLMWADEGLRAGQGVDVARDGGPWGILIGPEGGFSSDERERLRSLPFVVPVRLGPRILRADTAAVAAMTLWQMRHGDWR